MGSHHLSRFLWNLRMHPMLRVHWSSWASAVIRSVSQHIMCGSMRSGMPSRMHGRQSATVKTSFECSNSDELERVEDRAYLTKRDLTGLKGTAEEMGLVEYSWTCSSFLVVDPSKLGNELTALPEPVGSSCAQTGNKRERAKQRRKKAAWLEELHKLPCTAPHGVPGDFCLPL